MNSMRMSQQQQQQQQQNITEEARRSVLRAWDILPRSITPAFALASIQVPNLVLSESDPFLFFVSEGRDPYKAAIKVANYWTRRSSLFGDRVHIPMNRTGSGALTQQQDISCLLKDFCLQLLPPDSLGRTVYVIDAARVPDFSNDVDSRCIFYQLQRAIGNVLSVTEGIVILLYLTQRTLLGSLDALLQVMAKLIGTSMPFHLCRLHILSDQNPQVAPIATSAVVHQVLTTSISNECIVTVGTSPQDFLSKLLPFGLDRQGLPSALGGFQMIGPQVPLAGVAQATPLQVGYSWMAAQSAASHHSSSSYQQLLGSQSIVAGVARMPTRTSQQEQHDTHAAASAPQEAVDETDDRKPRARADSDVMDTKSGSGGKRPRADSATPANSSHNADDENHDPEEDNVHQNVEESQEERLRKRNALYSKRKYARKKIEIEVLQDQHRAFSEDKHRLVREKERLEGPLAQARECADMYERGDQAGLDSILATQVALQQQQLQKQQLQKQRQQQQQQLSALLSIAATAPPHQNGAPTSSADEMQGQTTAAAAINSSVLGQVTVPSIQGTLSPLEAALALSAAAATCNRGMAFAPPIQGTNSLSSSIEETMARAVSAYTGGARSIA
jgi:hypothetical protein